MDEHVRERKAYLTMKSDMIVTGIVLNKTITGIVMKIHQVTFSFVFVFPLPTHLKICMFSLGLQ